MIPLPTGAVGAQNAQIWAASILIELKPTSAQIRRLRARAFTPVGSRCAGSDRIGDRLLSLHKSACRTNGAPPWGRPAAWDNGLCRRISFSRSVISRC